MATSTFDTGGAVQAPSTATFPPLAPREPTQPAPARFGAAGISAGEERRYKRTLPPNPTWSRRPAPSQFARCLGWTSIALGLTEVAAGRNLAQWMGVDNHTDLIRAFGVREIANGACLVMKDSPRRHKRGVQARVVGDALDIVALANAMFEPQANRGRIAGVLGLVAGITALDLLCAGLVADR